MALIAADPDRYLPVVYTDVTPSQSATPTIMENDDYSDIINEEGILDAENVTLKYENVPDEQEVADLMEMLKHQGIILGPQEINEGLREDGWR